MTCSSARLKATGQVLITGRAIGQKIGAGPVRVVGDISDMDRCSPATCWSPT